MSRYTPMQLAEVFIKTGEFDDALEALHEQIAQYPDDMEAYRWRASILQRRSNPDDLRQAQADYDNIPSKTSDDYVNLSIVQQRLGNLENAIITMQNVYERYPDNERLVERLLQLQLEAKDYETAIKLVQSQSTHWRWQHWMGDIYVLIGEDENAHHAYQQVLPELQTQIDAQGSLHLLAIKGSILLSIAHCQRRLQQLDDAEKSYQEAQVILKDDPMLSFYLALIEWERNQSNKSITECKKIWNEVVPRLQAEIHSILTTTPAYMGLKEALNIT